MNLNNLKVQRYDGKLMDGKLMHFYNQLGLLNTRFAGQWVVKFVYIYFLEGVKYFQLRQIYVDIFKDNLLYVLYKICSESFVIEVISIIKGGNHIKTANFTVPFNEQNTHFVSRRLVVTFQPIHMSNFCLSSNLA